ncbi:MAG: hypothetical protein JRG91_08825 [Deltaproteobacteria bacterium]|nr:hypothetical protein [Deltaproteobacteria bacterium]
MKKLLIPALACLLALSPSCKKKGSGFEPDFACPGGPSCPDTGEEILRAGAAAVVINPTITEWMDVDADGDFEFEPHPLGDDTWNDVDGDGEWDATWIGGFGNARPARGIGTDLEARAVVLSWKSTTIAVVVVDLVGYFHSDIEKAREAIASMHPEIDFVSVSSTHTHNGPDTMGIWGFDELWPGWTEEYMQTVHDGIVQVVHEGFTSMVPAQVAYAAVEVDDHANGPCNFITDTRDPVIILNTMTLLHFTSRDSGDTISTFVNWHSHPEYRGESNDMITADFPHWLRLGIEEGVHVGSVDRDGVGGVTVYMSGAVGGLLCPYDFDDLYGHEGLDGATWERPGEGLDESLGWYLADIALTGLESATEPEDECPLEVKSTVLELEAHNYAYHAMMLTGVFHRDDIHGYDDTRPVGPGNFPRLYSEASWIRIGRAAALGVPGEPTAEHFVGGYDGSHTPPCYDGFIDPGTLSWPGNTNPPDLSLAPEGPYLFDRMRDRGVEYPMVFGLTGDEIGYLVPSYNFQLASPGAYLNDAEGDHYEETNSIGPDAWPAVQELLIGFIEY